MSDYNVDIFKDSECTKPLTSIKIGEENFENTDIFFRAVINQLEEEGTLQDKEDNDIHTLILANAIGFRVEKPIKNKVIKKIAGSGEEVHITSDSTIFSLAIPNFLRK